MFSFFKKQKNDVPKTDIHNTDIPEGIIPDGVYYQQDVGVRPRFTAQAYYSVKNGQMKYYTGIGDPEKNLSRCEYRIVEDSITIHFPDLAAQMEELGFKVENPNEESTYKFTWIEQSSKAKGFCLGEIKYMAK
jgi:hypothetical protein